MAAFASLTLVFLLSLLHNAAGAVVSRDLRITNKFLAPDGFNRSTVVAEGGFPSPLITANKGDRFRLNVVNRLTDNSMLRSTSIHWHGFFQRGTNWADGPTFINQCPIAANHSFLYEFSTTDQSGSYWYHSHHQTQYCDGLRGPIVVYDPNDPLKGLYDVDNTNTVITFADWYHLPAPSAGKFPTPQSTLINGRGRYDGGPAAPLSVVNVQRNRRYRLRLISLSCDPDYEISIDGHVMIIIEADGIATQPLTVDSLKLFAGQRYSVVLHTDKPIGNYWIRANPSIGTGGFANGINSAILRYSGAPQTDPSTPLNAPSRPLVEKALQRHGSTGPPMAYGRPNPGGADVYINLNVAFSIQALEFAVNGVPFHPPTVPVLLQILSGTRNPTELLPQGSVIPLPRNKVVEVSIPGGVIGGGHPIHMHGHAFDVIRSAGETAYNYHNPVRRDVVNMGTTGDNVTIRFVTDNPGPWFLHCHIEWHLEAGFAIVFAEDIPNTQPPSSVPQAWKDLCPIYESLTPDQL